jgi:predicted aldo/keto reductase-like oxidoreductase
LCFLFIFLFGLEVLHACPTEDCKFITNKSINVAYDFVRGEKRKVALNIYKENRATTGKGDCIDCKQCVNVCPTGIDIRNGTQLECVNCGLY